MTSSSWESMISLSVLLTSLQLTLQPCSDGTDGQSMAGPSHVIDLKGHGINN